jgi:hypothetical protein
VTAAFFIVAGVIFVLAPLGDVAEGDDEDDVHWWINMDLGRLMKIETSLRFGLLLIAYGGLKLGLPGVIR